MDEQEATDIARWLNRVINGQYFCNILQELAGGTFMVRVTHRDSLVPYLDIRNASLAELELPAEYRSR